MMKKKTTKKRQNDRYTNKKGNISISFNIKYVYLKNNSIFNTEQIQANI